MMSVSLCLFLAILSLFLITLTTSTPIQQLSNNFPCNKSTQYMPELNIDPILQQKIADLTANFHGDVGVYVRNMNTGKEAGINYATTFPTASIVKIPILIGIHSKLQSKELDLDQMMEYTDNRAYPGSGLMQYFKDKTQVELKTLVHLMISFSDNVASIWNQSLSGGGVTINNILQKNGFNMTYVNSSTPGREEDWQKYGWGQTTPYEMAQILIKIRTKELLSSEMSTSMYRFLGNHYYDDRSLSQIPTDIKTASKSGSLDASRSEVVYVNNPGPNGEYVFSIFTANNQDQSWDKNNEAEELARQLSKLLWTYYGY